MDVRTFDDAAVWLRAVEAYLLQDEARADLILGLADTLIRHPEVYDEKHLWAVVRGGVVMGAALQTPPHNLALARPANAGVLARLADAIDGSGIRLPGVTGADPEADAFAAVWSSLTGTRARRVMGQGVYSLRDVGDVPVPSGGSRKAEGPSDLALILDWLDEFQREVVPVELRGGPDETRRRAASVFTSDIGGFWFWEDDGRPVSMTGVGSATPNGVRIGPVFTPSEFRGRGYATALVATVTRDQLSRGHEFCFLHTDLANPTSNAIYRRIGYEHVCDSLVIAFEEG